MQLSQHTLWSTGDGAGVTSPQHELRALQLSRHQRIELERGTQTSPNLVLIVHLQERLAAGRLVDESLCLLQQVLSRDTALLLVKPRGDRLRVAAAVAGGQLWLLFLEKGEGGGREEGRGQYYI